MWRTLLITSLLLPALAACKEEVKIVEAPIRAIKSIVIKQRAGKQVRRIAGIVEADLVTDIAFEVPGKILELDAEVGDKVEIGALVARLDPEPYLLKIRSTEAKLSEANAKLKDATAKFSQQSTLFVKGFATQTALDSARAVLEGATSAVELATSTLELTKRDFKKTNLIIPVNGQVTGKYTKKFSDVTAGQKVIQISSDGQMKIKATVPEGMVQRIKVGDEIEVDFPTILEEHDGYMVPQEGKGRIIEIAGSAGSTNSYAVTARLLSNHPEANPGMTVTVSFEFTTQATGKAFLLPITAMLPIAAKGGGTVFVFDKQEQVVHQRRVKVVNIRDNELEVTGEIKAGDIVAVAGVSFLHDKMKVSLFDATAAR